MSATATIKTISSGPWAGCLRVVVPQRDGTKVSTIVDDRADAERFVARWATQ